MIFAVGCGIVTVQMQGKATTGGAGGQYLAQDMRAKVTENSQAKTASGWFAVKRGITSHPLFAGRPDRLAIWIWLLDNACWKDTFHDINGKTVMVPRGSVAASERRIAAEVGVGRQVVRTFLGRLRTDNMINPDPTHGRNIISLCNWEKYQASQPTPNPQANPRPTHDQPIKEQVNNIPYGASASPRDLRAIIFSDGLALLGRAGVSERQGRSLLGKWCKERGDAAVIDALGRAQREGAIDPVSFIEGCFRFTAKKAGPELGDERVTKAGKRQRFIGGEVGWANVV